MMNDQDKRAVEGMARCGIDLEGLCSSFPNFPVEEIEEVYKQVQQMEDYGSIEPDIKCCGFDAR